MVLPVIQHRLTKINRRTRRIFIRSALFMSLFGCANNFIAGLTNEWLYTAEVLRFFVLPNATHVDENVNTVYFKNATLGPWYFCYLDPVTAFHCNKVHMFSSDEPSDVTSSIESYFFVYLACLLDLFGLGAVFVCSLKKKPYTSLFLATNIHICAGIADFSSIIMYMSGMSKEVGNNLFPASEMDDPLFYYTYGYSFIAFKIGFLCTETAAILLVLVYMSKRDERTYNRYCINAIMRNVRDKSPLDDQMILNGRYHQHARMSKLQRASRSASIDASIESEGYRRFPSDAYMEQFRKSPHLLPPTFESDGHV